MQAQALMGRAERIRRICRGTFKALFSGAVAAGGTMACIALSENPNAWPGYYAANAFLIAQSLFIIPSNLSRIRNAALGRREANEIIPINLAPPAQDLQPQPEIQVVTTPQPQQDAAVAPLRPQPTTRTSFAEPVRKTREIGEQKSPG